MLHDLVLKAYIAAGTTPTTPAGGGTGADFLTGTTLGQSLGAIMKAGAIIVGILAALKATKDGIGGKIGKALSVALGGLAIAVFLWQPSLINHILDLFGNLMGQAADTTDQLVR